MGKSIIEIERLLEARLPKLTKEQRIKIIEWLGAELVLDLLPYIKKLKE